MKKACPARRWLLSLAACIFALALAMSALMYIIDPYFQFRVRDDSYLLNPQYVNGGLIKNHDYDTLIIGSSMTQNFDMDLFRQKLGAEPLHVSLGGMTMPEMCELLELSLETGKAQEHYIGIDIWTAMKQDSSSQNPSYLISSGFVPALQYLFSHEAWFYSLPHSCTLLLRKQLNIEIPESIRRVTSIDELGNWEADYTCGEDIVLAQYRGGTYAVSDADNDRLIETARRNIDGLLSVADRCPAPVRFFLPPYSGLFWHSKAEYMETMLEIKRYFVEAAHARGHIVYDFQGQDFISDLNNYRDITHYGGHINDWMVDRFAAEECIVTPEDLDRFNEDLLRNVEATAAKYLGE